MAYDVTTAAASLEFDTQAGLYNSCAKVDTNHFINFWQGVDIDGFAQIFTVNTTTWAVTTAAAPLEFDTQNNLYNACVKIDTNHFLNFWQGFSGDGFVQVFTVNTTTWAVTTAAASLEFDTQDNLINACFQVDTNHFINFSRSLNSDGVVQILEVNTTTWAVTVPSGKLTYEDVLATPQQSCFKVDTNHFINFWGGTVDSGFAQVFTVNTTTWDVTTAAASLAFSTSGGTHHSCYQVDTNHFINFFKATADNDGFAQVFTVNTTTWVITTAAASLEFDTQNDNYNRCVQVDSNHFILFYGGFGDDGFSLVFAVNTTTWEITTTAASLEFDTQNNRYNTCFQVDTSHFIDFWNGGSANTQGFVQIFAVALQKTIDLLETVVLVDTVTKTATKALSATITLVAGVSVVKIITQTLSETIILVDTITKTATKALSATVTLADSVFKNISRALTDVVTMVDAVVTSTVFQRVLTETLTVVDTVLASYIKNITLVETIVLDAVVAFFKRAKGFILGRNTDTGIKIGKRADALGRNTDTGIKIGKKLD